MPFIDATRIAAAERLARFERDRFGADLATITTALIGWRDRERLTLSDTLLGLIAAHIIAGSHKAAA
jgi:hypothetical protein